MNKTVVKKARPNPPTGGSGVPNKPVILSTNIIDISAIDKVDKLLASLLKVQKLLQQIII